MQHAQFQSQPLAQFIAANKPNQTPTFLKYGSSSHTWAFWQISTPTALQAFNAYLPTLLALPSFAPQQATSLAAYFAKHLQNKFNAAAALGQPLLIMLSPTTKQAYLFNLASAPSWGLQIIHPAASYMPTPTPTPTPKPKGKK